MAIRNGTRNLGAVLLLLCGAACGRDREAQPSDQHAVTLDACVLVGLSESELARKTNSARRGDVSAQKELWDHYLACGGQKEVAYWEDRLVLAGDMDAMARRSEGLFFQARKLDDSDPRKLSLLRDAQRLEKKARLARGRGVDRVLINGKEVEIPYSPEPGESAKMIDAELKRTTAAQGKQF